MTPETKVIAIVGMPGAGKSVAAEFFRKKGVPVLRFGDQTDIGLKELGMELNEKNERWYREKIRQELGMAAMAIKIEPRIKTLIGENQLIILDGLYSWEEFQYLIGKFPGLKLLCIYARPEIRYGRLTKRQIRPLTPEDARSRDFAEIEKLNKGGPIAIADRLLVNEGSRAEIEDKLEEYFQEL